MLVYGLIIWFFQTRLSKLTGHKDAIMGEVTQGLDLLSDDTPLLHASENNFKVGVSLYAQRRIITGCDQQPCGRKLIKESIDISRVSSIFHVAAVNVLFTEGKASLKEIEQS